MNLTLRMSEDEGATWPFARRIEDGFSGYSDLAVASDGTILCFYERGSTDGASIYRTGRLTVARIAPEWLATGRPGGNH
jgi:sialidase-1